jgi:hypothetical protein
MIDETSRIVLLSFGHRVDEMKTMHVPDDYQYRLALIDPSDRHHSGFIILRKSQ